MAKEVPVELNIFDVLYYDGNSTINEPYEKRRKIIEKIIKDKEYKIKIAEQIVTDDSKKAESFYKKSLDAGNEGIMLKSLNAPYKPGSRVGYMVKLKPVMETLDLVIVGAEWGEGKRTNWLTSYTMACRDSEDNLLEIGKVSTGVKELSEMGTSYEQMTELLKPIIIKEKGKAVTLKPEVVIEVKYEEIQKSPTYSSGYALRFPRFIRLREDRGITDIDTIDTVEELFHQQRHR